MLDGKSTFLEAEVCGINLYIGAKDAVPLASEASYELLQEILLISLSILLEVKQ